MRPLVEHLDGRPLALRLSGWLHATPIAPVLTAALNYETPVVVSLGLDRPDRAGLTSRDRRVAVVAAGGDGYRYNHLAHVAEDLDVLRELFDEAELVRFHDATVQNALPALESIQSPDRGARCVGSGTTPIELTSWMVSSRLGKS